MRKREEMQIMKLKITLKSDLCAAVGKHYAAMIDVDTAFDKYGIPFIPSRRIKGCMKEIAEMYMSEDAVKRIFGKIGSDKSGSLYISDAHLKNYEALKAEIIKENISAEKVTELYCSVRGETEIENDIAKEKSLRYIRVVNSALPESSDPLEFYSDIVFDEKDKKDIAICIKALRNIGYHRNRGLGAVECSFDCSSDQNDCFVFDKNNLSGCKELRITVRLDSDLMLPDSDANHSADYITGTMLLGALAGKYIKKNGEKDFNDIFFSDVTFGNLYPAVISYNSETDNLKYSYTIPAPRYFAKIKAAAKEEDFGIKNIINNHSDKQFKVLKKGYISEEYGHITPETKIVYHNGNIKSAENDGGLYMQYCLSSGQYFSGIISGPKEKIAKIIDLFYEGESFNGILRFGRSKTAQYAQCRICEFRDNMKDTEAAGGSSAKKFELKKCIAAYRLESDVLLLNEDGNEDGKITTELEKLCMALNVDMDKSCLRAETSIAVKTVSGYNSKWNMKKPQFPVIAAGSVIVFNMDMNDRDKNRREINFLGEKQNEGYGRIRLITDAELDSVNSNTPEIKLGDKEWQSSISEILKRRQKLENIAKLGIDNAKYLKLNSAQVGRITLMLKDADKTKGDKFIDFEKRINSIKTSDVLEKAIENLGEKVLERKLSDFGIEFIDCNVVCGKNNSRIIIKTVSDSDWKYVYKYILTVLTVKKYQLKKER